MMHTIRLTDRTVGLFLGVVLLAGSAMAADVWVSGTGDDGLLGDGSITFPFRTISRAMLEAIPDDTIKVLSGDFGVADGETFPIAIKHGVDVLGQETVATNYPRIGGDVEDGNVRALFEVVASTSDRLRITIGGLRFVGEDTEEEDAPSAIFVETSGGYVARVAIQNCIFERSRMNESGVDGRPTVLAIAGRRSYEEEPEGPGDPERNLELHVTTSSFTPTDRGGIEINIGPDASSTMHTARVKLVVQQCSFTLSGGETALFAIDNVLECYTDSEDPLFADGLYTIVANDIDARQCTSSGLNDGIRIGAHAKFDGLGTISHTGPSLVANRVRGCSEAAIRFVAIDEGEGAGTNIQTWNVQRNVLTENPGDGLVFDWRDAYMNFQITNEWIADNGGSGLVIRGPSLNPSGDIFVGSCTITGNGGYGILIDDIPAAVLWRVQKSIVWGNSQGSASGWDPTSDPSAFTNSDWEGLFGLYPSCTPDGDGNVDADPDFVDAGNGDYHLGDTSCLIGKGTNSPAFSLTEFDIDREDRIHGTNVDIGADEYHPEE